MKNKISGLLGIQSDTTSHKEKFISAFGGFLGIFFILHITNYFIDGLSGALIVASMGASAVLLFAVPHGPLSQPWPLIGGHVISAFIGVTIAHYFTDVFLAAAIAVGLSIGVMYYLRCIHPPGGATALATVVSGSAVYDLGYQFVITPVFLNALVLLLTAILVNYFFKWRRYPAFLSIKTSNKKPTHGLGLIPRSDLQYALKAMQSFADISAEELEEIYTKAAQHKKETSLSAQDIQLGRYYLHGEYTDAGVIRRVIDESADKKNDMIIYKIITGPRRQETGTTTRELFAKWAKHEVVFINDQWEIANKKEIKKKRS